MMRATAVWSLLALPLLVAQAGCAGFGKLMADDATLPGANPNMPAGDAENLRRARGEAAIDPPILPQGGNVWPGPPPPLPSLGDASRERLGPNDGLPADATGPNLPEGGTLSAGEQAEIRGGVPGVSDAGAPSVAHDESARYRSGQAASTIVIPNGDGSSTVITPDGTVKTVKDTSPVPN
jgi:hypothetical protein